MSEVPLPAQTIPLDVEHVDISHLNLLGIFYFVLGPLVMLFGSIPIVHIVLGIMILSGTFAAGQNQRWIGLIFIVIGGTIVLLAWATGLLAIYAGLQLRRRRRWMLCMVAAGAICLFMPLGTVLGVFTLVVLMRPSVRPLFS